MTRHCPAKHLDRWPEVTVAIDAVGEGSGLADRLQQAYPEVHRFKAGATADEATEYKDCWAEGLAELGSWLAAGGTIDDHHLREELLAAARTVTFNECHLASRGSDGATVLQASPKRNVKDQIGRSPDCLDAALMAVWADAGHTTTTRHVVRRGPPGKRETGTAAGSGRRVRRRSGAELTSHLEDSP